MRLLRALADHLRADLPRLRGRHERGRLAGAQEGELFLDRGDRLVRDETSRERDHASARRVIPGHEGAQGVRVHRQDDLLATGDLPAERMPRIEELVDERVHAVLRLVAVHPQLLDDDAPLGLYVVRAQHRRADHVRDHVEGDEVVARGDARPEHRDLFVSRGVHESPAALDLLADVRGRRTLCGPLEDHVLEEVARPGVELALDTRAHPDVDGDRDRSRLGHLRHENAQSVRHCDSPVLHRGEL